MSEVELGSVAGAAEAGPSKIPEAHFSSTQLPVLPLEPSMSSLYRKSAWS